MYFLTLLSSPQVVYNVGLCICLYDITKLEDSYIFPGDGASHTKGLMMANNTLLPYYIYHAQAAMSCISAALIALAKYFSLPD